MSITYTYELLPFHIYHGVGGMVAIQVVYSIVLFSRAVSRAGTGRHLPVCKKDQVLTDCRYDVEHRPGILDIFETAVPTCTLSLPGNLGVVPSTQLVNYFPVAMIPLFIALFFIVPHVYAIRLILQGGNQR